MHPVLFQLPAFPAWIAAVLVVLLGAVFAWFGRKDPKDSGSWWLAGACGVGAAWLLIAMGPTGTVGPLPIRLFGILVVLGFLAGAKVLAMRNQRLGYLTGEESFDLAFYVLLAGLIGARIFHVLQNFDKYAGHPVEMMKIWDGGLVWYGGALGSTLYAWYWLAKGKKDLWGVSDSIALAAPVGHAVGRIGCFMAGCDYGKVVEGGREALPWAVHFPNKVIGQEDYCLVPNDFRYDPETDQDVYIHPAQLYEAGALLLVFGLLWILDRKVTKGAFRGRLSAAYLVAYAVERSIVEHWRGDADRGTYFGGTVSFSQIVSAIVFVAGIMMYSALKNRAPAAPAKP
jgi:phosphatidylglycerol:prolipoprotein diacylglycerol transferase